MFVLDGEAVWSSGYTQVNGSFISKFFLPLKHLSLIQQDKDFNTFSKPEF
jgi:hypothetical protein